MNKLNLPVDEFTTPDPITAVETSSIEDMVHLMKENGVRHLPIIRDGKVVGIVSDRDIRLASGLNSREKMQIEAKHIMASDPVTVNSQTSLDEVALEMSRSKIGSVIVNDENEKFLGIFTVTDALNALIEIARSSEKNI
ncbi:MAG: CBS domain-containing protein [Bdellovibrionaceae bacterium]|nr:CBS domain-containing protein [Pseudobdellovibrionaceae bacterium]